MKPAGSSLATAPLLDVRDLRVTFSSIDGEAAAVDGLSFTLEPGETLAIVGESGSGKSVTAKSIMRLIDFMGGRIRDGSILLARDGNEPVDLARLPESKLKSLRGSVVSLVFQEPMTSLNPVLTIGEQIVETIVLHEHVPPRAALARAREALRQVRIPDPDRRLQQYPHELSGGMRQRVMIAMALACRPALLIADEPTTALDVTIQAEILALLKTLQAKLGMAILFITHDMGVVAEMADRVLVMRNGRMVECGPVDRIFHQPTQGYTRDLLAAIPRLGSMHGIAAPAPFVLPHAGPAPAPAAVKTAAPAREAPILEVDRLSVRFPVRKGALQRIVANVHAVEDVSFKLYPAETLSIVGESGSGKSTIGRALLRLVPPSAGDIILRGRNITDVSPKSLQADRRYIQMIFQDPFASLNPRMTVEQIVAEPLRIHGTIPRHEIRPRVAGLLDRVGLSSRVLHRYPFEFSGGQRQRICIARALALNPSVIVADEAVSALDVSIRAQVINLMLELQQDLGIAYLFISHDIAVVERISHRIAVIYMGEIVEYGSRASVIEHPEHPYTRRLMAAVPTPDPAHRTLRTLDPSEPASALRPLGYVPETRAYREVRSGHWVMTH